MHLAIVTSVMLLTSNAVGGPASPLATLKQKNSEVDRLLHIKTEAGSQQDKKVKEDIKSLAGQLLDYGELTRRAMAEHWDKISPAQRNELVGTLKQLIERNYVKQLRSNMDYKVQYKDEQVAGEEATVESVVKVKTRGKSTDADIVYKLRRVSGDWRVWDVITDEVSLMRNYKSQFHRIITEQGFDQLLKKMKSKLNDEEK